MSDEKQDHVYIVSEGEYSDYRVLAAYTHEIDAVAYAREVGGRVEVRPLDADAETLEEVLAVCVWMREGGKAEIHGPFKLSRYTLGFQEYGRIYHEPHAPHQLFWCVETDDTQRAVKVVNEKRAQIIAAEVWGDELATRALFAKDKGGTR
jgi:hypothetical protein